MLFEHCISLQPVDCAEQHCNHSKCKTLLRDRDHKMSEIRGGARQLNFIVTIPEDSRLGEPFLVVAGGLDVRVRRPEGTLPGQRLLILVSAHPDSDGVTRAEGGGDRRSFLVTIPEGTRRGGWFGVVVAGRSLRVRRPWRRRPGQRLRIKVPAPPPDSENVTMIPDVEMVPEGELHPGEKPAYSVVIPQSAMLGEQRQFPIFVSGKLSTVTCPDLARPGMSVRVTLSDAQLFEVEVPRWVAPGEHFNVLVGRSKIRVTCPQNVTGGQKIRFRIPIEKLRHPLIIPATNVQYDMKPLLGEWEMKLLPYVVEWFPADRSSTTPNDDGGRERLCPITAETMRDPVVLDADCGHVVSREAARKWIEVHGMSCCLVCGKSVKGFDGAGRRKLDAIYQFTRAMPHLVPEWRAALPGRDDRR